jgi:hypothetical protein
MGNDAHEHGHAHEATSAESIFTGLLITGSVDGEVTAVFDTRTAAVAGAACGTAYYLLTRLFRS